MDGEGGVVTDPQGGHGFPLAETGFGAGQTTTKDTAVGPWQPPAATALHRLLPELTAM